ncbi:hypothetical protein [Streptomyces virginiae]|uniref:EfeO-type cupredoxin-like domain-containing protein n=1 Tax=Streptomyces virginiae TaxID=1961 RepID=A0ABZ1TTR5_STRVG|nr:hypothetical protein [Streptomyces virginiae]
MSRWIRVLAVVIVLGGAGGCGEPEEVELTGCSGLDLTVKITNTTGERATPYARASTDDQFHVGLNVKSGTGWGPQPRVEMEPGETKTFEYHVDPGMFGGDSVDCEANPRVAVSWT